MSLLDSYLSGTQTLGSFMNYWHIIIMVLILIILLYVFLTAATAKKWPPPCPKDGDPPSGTSCSVPKIQFLAILGFIMLLLVGIIYFNWTSRNNKFFQTTQGVETEYNILKNIF